MTNKKLTSDVVAARMVELRNLRRLHAHDRKQIGALKAENVALRALVAEQQIVIEKLQIQMAELQTMVFGKKRQSKLPPDDGTPSSGFSVSPRTPDSYHRATPPDSSVTATMPCPVGECAACGGQLTDIELHERYVEDIPLPELTPGYVPRLVTKYLVERGRCTHCGKHTSGRNLGGAQVSLGTNVRLLVCHLISVVGLSYGQTASLLLALYGLVVSKAELSVMLQSQHQAWLPAYDQLKADIRAAPVVHLDETPWPIQRNDRLGHAWVLADAHTPKVCFALENSRGVVHAKALVGEAYHGIRVSDDYGAYRSLSGTQQLCWAHLYRTIRDLRYNANLPKEQLPTVTRWYEHFAAIYQDLRMYLTEPYDEVVRATQATGLWQQVQALANSNSGKNSEPDKLTRLKAQLLRAGPDRLFVCLAEDTPCDNNRAERDLRQLVLKRKRSFGSQTERGAKALATVLSLCTTAWRTAQPTKYFSALASLGG
jgi:transposase